MNSVLGLERGRRNDCVVVVFRAEVAGVDEAGVGGVADWLCKGGWSAAWPLGVLGALPVALLKAVSEPFVAGGGADVLIVSIQVSSIFGLTNSRKESRDFSRQLTTQWSILCRKKILACDK
jgi:hypothetical protein